MEVPSSIRQLTGWEAALDEMEFNRRQLEWRKTGCYEDGTLRRWDAMRTGCNGEDTNVSRAATEYRDKRGNDAAEGKYKVRS